MSEKPDNTPEDFDPLAESVKRANGGKQIYEEFMERDAENNLSAEQHVEAYQQMSDYLKSRPYKDRNGRLHDPITGGFISDEEAGVFYAPSNAETKEGEEVDEYKSMSLSSLAALSAEAEYHDDKTTMLSVDDEIQQRILDMDLKDELAERDGAPRENSERSMVLEHVMKLRDQYLDKMKKDADESVEAEDEDKPEQNTKNPEEIGSTEDGEQNPPKEKLDDKKPEGEKEDSVEKPEDNKGEEFDPWVEFGKVAKEVEDSQIKKEIGTNLNGEDMSKIAEIARNKVEGNMPLDEDDYYSGGEIRLDTPDVDENQETQLPNMEISDTAREALTLSRDRYVNLSAKRRTEILGKSKEELEIAKSDYEIAMRQVNEEIYRALIEADVDPVQAKMMIIDSSLAESTKLMENIAQQRIEDSANKRLAKFYDWFGKQNGFKGFVKKMAATAAVTTPIGLAASAAGIVLLGPVGGAFAGVALARGISRGLAAGKISKEAGAKTLAAEESLEDIAEATRAINEWILRHPEEALPPQLITEIAERTTQERLSENRRRTAKIATIGALVGLVSAYGTSWLADRPSVTGGGETGGNTPPTPTIENIPTGGGEYLNPETIPAGSFKFPWGWAESTFGGDKATPMLETLVKRAQDAGVKIDWNPNPGGTRYIEVGGASDAQSVINVLKQFVKPGELPVGK